MVLLIIIPTKWLFHWGYTPFSDIPILELLEHVGTIPLKPHKLHRTETDQKRILSQIIQINVCIFAMYASRMVPLTKSKTFDQCGFV